MEDIFEPKSLNIKNLFGSPDSLFQVPIYQRPYSWEDEEVEKLWEDLYGAYENQEENSNYFLGSIITIPKDNGYQDIVDGQQRITTLMILFCVIRDLYPNINQNIDIGENSQVIKMKRIKGFICDVDDRTRLKLQTQPSDQNDLEQCVLKVGATSEETLSGQDKKSVKFKFIQTAKIFKEKLSSIEEEEVGRFVNYIGNYVKIIKITCKDRSFAVKLFQVLNDRGKDLDPSDLIKSDLLNNLPESKHEQFIADWNQVKNTIKDFDCKGEMDDMFTLYVYYHLGANPKKSTYEEMKSISKNKDSNQIINDFKEFCSLYKDQLSNSSNKIINCLWYLNWGMHWNAVLITALKEKFSEYQGLVSELRRYYYLNWIAGKTVNTIKQISFNLIKFIKEGKSLSFIKEELEKKLKADNIFQLALSHLSYDVSRTSWIKPVLMMMEYHQTDGDDKDFVRLDRTVHCEHILPVQYKEISGWEHISETVAENYLNSIGNLTLLGGRKNIEASNNPFKVKLNVYKGRGKYNDSKKGVTNFQITQKIAQDVSEGHIKQWDKKAMKDRWNWFLNELEELLRIDTSSIRLDEQNKIEDIKNQVISISTYKKEQSEKELSERKNRKEERKQKNKEFFNQFISEIKEEYPDFDLKHLTNNAVRVDLLKPFSHITVFRTVNSDHYIDSHHYIGMFWAVREETANSALFHLIKEDSSRPNSFQIYDDYLSMSSIVLEEKERFKDIYDPSSYPEQIKFLKENLILLYRYMAQKISELEKSNQQKVG